MSDIHFPRPHATDQAISLEMFNSLLTEVERLSKMAAGGQVSFVNNASGVFPQQGVPDWGRFELNDDLSASSPASAKQLTWNGVEFVNSGITKTLYGDFIGDATISSGTRVFGSLSPGGRWEVVNGGGSSARRVKFTITSFDEDTGIAVCAVKYASCGSDVESPINVYDPAGCFFNETPDDLVGRWGDADLMYSLDDPYRECIWVCSGLCCAAS